MSLVTLCIDFPVFGSNVVFFYWVSLVFKVHGIQSTRKVQYHQVGKSTSASGMGRPREGRGSRGGRGGRGRGRGRGDAPPAAADDDDEDVVLDAMEGTVCSYCTTETEEELKRCISYDTGCKVEWRDVPAWIKTQLGCDKSIHLSCAKKNKAYEGGTPAANASYPEIGFCEGCFKDVEEARFN